jgi:hypothetical protein
MLCPANALERIQQAINYSQRELACLTNVTVAVVSVEGRQLVKDSYRRIGLPDFFADLESAKMWANQTLQNHRSGLIQV